MKNKNKKSLLRDKKNNTAVDNYFQHIPARICILNIDHEPTPYLLFEIWPLCDEMTSES